MTDIDITPESLNAHADWIDGCGHGLGPGAALRHEAARLGQARADEKRIDELARIYWTASIDSGHFGETVEYDRLSEAEREGERAGVRAILAKLDEEKAELKRINGGNGGWPTSFDHPETVSIILGGTE